GKSFLENAPQHALTFGFNIEPISAPLKFIDEESEIKFGSSLLKIIYTPGHADGSVCFVSEESKLVIVGDVLFRESIGRTDLPQDTAQSVYNRMRSDRIASAAQIRAVGEQQKLRIESEADRERTVILAEAQRLSEILRGEGEGERNLILVTAQNQDPEFFAFYRSMEAYGAALTDGTTWVLSPDSEFFRYFNEVPVQSAQ
ncbi:MAG: MBL fold metallo-hydrolase, partial [Rhodospirillales bacterium]|nr:MBL fold metallo-hydrolase [Rhodospirillales bacterium]